MVWTEQKEKFDTSGGRLKRTSSQKKRQAVSERVFTISEVADIFRVNKQTVYKWLSPDPEENCGIAFEDWYKLPRSGQVRIYERAIIKLQGSI
ncbi:hypothetical protein ACFL2O_07795 [Thermodesulfobacteriota bacterium]